MKEIEESLIAISDDLQSMLQEHIQPIQFTNSRNLLLEMNQLRTLFSQQILAVISKVRDVTIRQKNEDEHYMKKSAQAISCIKSLRQTAVEQQEVIASLKKKETQISQKKYQEMGVNTDVSHERIDNLFILFV
jgi:hypothetical protein